MVYSQATATALDDRAQRSLAACLMVVQVNEPQHTGNDIAVTCMHSRHARQACTRSCEDASSAGRRLPGNVARAQHTRSKQTPPDGKNTAQRRAAAVRHPRQHHLTHALAKTPALSCCSAHPRCLRARTRPSHLARARWHSKHNALTERLATSPSPTPAAHHRHATTAARHTQAAAPTVRPIHHRATPHTPMRRRPTRYDEHTSRHNNDDDHHHHGSTTGAPAQHMAGLLVWRPAQPCFRRAPSSML